MKSRRRRPTPSPPWPGGSFLHVLLLTLAFTTLVTLTIVDGFVVEPFSSQTPQVSSIGEAASAAVMVDDSTGLPVLFLGSFAAPSAVLMYNTSDWVQVFDGGAASAGYRPVSPLWLQWERSSDGWGVFAPAVAPKDVSSCIRRYTNSRVYAAALETCENLHPAGHLATISSLSRACPILTFTNDESFLGGSQSVLPTTQPWTGWQWIAEPFFTGSDNLQGTAMGQKLWNDGEPNQYNGNAEDFLSLRSGGMNDIKDSNRPYICELDYPSTVSCPSGWTRVGASSDTVLRTRTYTPAGTGPGHVSPASDSSVSNARGAAAIDANGDGAPDVIVAAVETPTTLQILAATSAVVSGLTFPNPLGYQYASDVAAFDADRDLQPDFVLIRYMEPMQAASFTGASLVDTTAARGLDAWAPQRLLRIVAGDIDADGDVDFLAFGYRESKPVVAINDGFGHFTDGAAAAGLDTAGTDVNTGDVLLYDLTHDGRVDLVLLDKAGTVYLYVNTGTGQFSLFSTIVLSLVANTLTTSLTVIARSPLLGHDVFVTNAATYQAENFVVENTFPAPAGVLYVRALAYPTNSQTAHGSLVTVTRTGSPLTFHSTGMVGDGRRVPYDVTVFIPDPAGTYTVTVDFIHGRRVEVTGVVPATLTGPRPLLEVQLPAGIRRVELSTPDSSTPAVRVGERVVATLTAMGLESGLTPFPDAATCCSVNGAPAVFASVLDGLYLLEYVVGANDSSASPGEVSVNGTFLAANNVTTSILASAIVPNTVSIDTLPPTVSVCGGPASGSAISAVSFTVCVECQDVNGCNVSYSLTSGPGAMAVDVGRPNATVALGPFSHEDVPKLFVWASDGLGNVAQPVRLSWTVDLVAPESLIK